MPSSTKSPARPRKPLRRRKMSLASIIWAVTTLLLSIAFLIVQGTLLMVFTALSLMITALSVLADRAASTSAVPAQPAKKAPTPQVGSSARKKGADATPCTATGTPVDRCTCARRHITSTAGAERYHGRVGDPLGKGKKP